MSIHAISMDLGDYFGKANEYALAFIVDNAKTKFEVRGVRLQTTITVPKN